MRLFGKTSIDFMGKRKLWYLISGSLITIGLISLLIRGVEFGIDFLGGTELVVGFAQPVQISDVRAAMDRAGFDKAEIKTFGTDRDILIRTPQQGEGTTVGDRIRSGLAAAFPGDPFTVLKEDKIGPKIGAELRRDAIYAVVASLLAIMLYVAFRFKFIYGVGAVLALFHDVLITLGVISIVGGLTSGLNLEISQNMIAAFLTLVGLSVNDTVVIFDRIRENQKIFRSMKLIDVINKSLNETLSRTIITSGTIFVVLIVLLVFGGEVNRGFAFALTIGIVTGTYSSIYIASAVVVDWSIRAQRKAELID
jgi:preprotein translocase SecF subunit